MDSFVEVNIFQIIFHDGLAPKTEAVKVFYKMDALPVFNHVKRGRVNFS